jgi:hypothetical protein
MSSNLLCIQKRKSRAALRAHRAWQRLQGQPLQRARTALARIRARVSYFENFVTEVEGLRLAQRSIRINQTSGCVRGPSRGNRVCKRNATSQRRNGAVRRHVGGKTNASRTGSRHEVYSSWRAANVARRRPKKCTLQMEVVPDRRAMRSSRIASCSALGATSMTWAAAEGSASRRIEEARQARQWFDDRRATGRRKKLDHPPQSPRRRETAGCSNVRSA